MHFFFLHRARPSPDVINGAAAKPQRHHPIVGTLITSSGMGAISTVLLALLAAGDHIICGTGVLYSSCT
jgi:cystathionine beta-lyase/cystathionine gamma-synthase